MSRLCVVVFLLLFFNCIAQNNLKKANSYANVITPETLKKHLAIVAGADMEGRETATDGQRKAAVYIENTMKEAGLLPANNGSYQMSYPVYDDSVINAGLVINNIPMIWKTDFNTPAYNFNASMYYSEIVYVNADDSLWKQNKLDVTGRLVMFGIVNTKPEEKDKAIIAFINSAMRRGATAALIIDTFNISKSIPGNMSLNKYPSGQSINYYIITPETAEKIIKNGIDSSRLPSLVYKEDIRIDFEKTRVRLESSNVIGYIEGSTKKDEFLIISAHYDHLGKKDSLVWYGADDDGSGTVTVLALAKAFEKAKAEGHGPLRSIVFITFSGEEKGLWGSKIYTSNPIFPFQKTTAALNVDMIGRLDSTHIKNNKPNYVYLVGDNKLCSELPTIAKAANVYTGLELNSKYNDPKDPEKIYSRSDHYNFAKKGVPVIFYYDGGHPDYHRVTDTVDKIDFELMSKRAKLIFYTAWEIANRKEMLLRDKAL